VAIAAGAFVQPVWAQGPPGAQEPVEVRTARFSYKFNINYFLQASTRQNYPFNDERFVDHESFIWERLRPKVTLSNQHISVVVEAQDTHARGSEFAVRRAWLDLLNAYVDVTHMKGVSFKVGRRQGDFDTIPRLVRTSDFAAVVRSFDVAEVGWVRRTTAVRAFVFRTVDNLPDRFNTWKKGERLWTAHIRQGVGHHALQTYVTTRLNTDVMSESGVAGSGAVHAWETLATGPTPFPHLTYSVEHILERGHFSTDTVRASAFFGTLSLAPKTGHEIEVRYVRTSGDEVDGDGLRGNYDTFYMALNQLGSLGLMRGANLHAISIGGTHTVAPKTDFTWRIYDSHLTTTQDGWYSTRFIQRPDPTSSRVGNELNTQLSYTVSSHLNARLGFYRFFQGPYLKETHPGGSYEVRLQIFGNL